MKVFFYFLFTFPEEDAAKIAMRFLGVFQHGAERTFSSDAADLLIGQWKAEELRDFLHTFWQVLHGRQDSLRCLYSNRSLHHNRLKSQHEVIYLLLNTQLITVVLFCHCTLF